MPKKRRGKQNLAIKKKGIYNKNNACNTNNKLPDCLLVRLAQNNMYQSDAIFRDILTF